MISNIETWPFPAKLGAIGVAAAIFSATIIVGLHPLLKRYALVRPNARSSHAHPTPQGGGIAVIAATIITVVGTGILAPDLLNGSVRLTIVFASIIGLAAVGATDDVRPLEALPRLLLQACAVMIVVAALPHDLRVLSMLPWWFERALLVIGSLWLVNLVNFMDGIDWMTVAEFIPVTGGLVLAGTLGALPTGAMVVALAICGAVAGFAPFNRPVARLFLGDVGSLPLGLLLAWLLVLLAGRGHLAAAVLLPLYYVADATITLLRRLINHEPLMLAHRTHFYQRAMDAGFGTYQIVGRVLVVNIVLVGLAAVTILSASPVLHIASLAIGGATVGALLWTFARSPKTPF